jgi:hypothetical protein
VAVCAIIVFSKLRPKNNQPVIEASSDEESNIEKTEETPEAPRPPLDILGIITLSCAILCFVILVEMLEDLDAVKRHIGLIVGLGVGFIVFTATFISIEVFWAKNPVIPLHLLKTTQVGLIWGTTFFMQMGNYSVCPRFSSILALNKGPVKLISRIVCCKHCPVLCSNAWPDHDRDWVMPWTRCSRCCDRKCIDRHACEKVCLMTLAVMSTSTAIIHISSPILTDDIPTGAENTESGQ